MSILIKGIDLPKKIKAQHQHSSEYECETYIELYIRSDGVVFDDEFEEVGQAIQIDLVRCGECKHYKREECRLDPFWERYTEPNDFCSRGERRADEGATE